jgi:hypothetical protein
VSAVRELLAVFGIDVDDSDVKKADKTIKGLVDTVKSLGAVVAAGALVNGLNNMINRSQEMADHFSDTSKKIGVSAEALQYWEFAAKGVGVSAETVAGAFGILQKNVFDATHGNEESAKMFKRLGVSLTDAGGKIKKPSDLMMEMADGLSSVENETERTAIAMTLLGKSGKELKPIFDGGSAGVREMFGELDKLGGPVGGKTIATLNELGDASDGTGQSLNNLSMEISANLAPAKVWLLKLTKNVVVWFRKHEGAAKGLTTAIIAVTAAMTALGMAMAYRMAAPFAAKTTAMIVSSVAALMNWGKAMIFLAMQQGGMRAIASAGWAMLAPFLKAGLILAGLVAIGLIIEDIIVLFKGGNSAIGEVIDSLFGFGAAAGYVNDVKLVWDALIESIATAIEYVVKFFSAVTNAPGKVFDFLAMVGGDVAKGVRGAWDGASGTINSVANGVKGAVNEAGRSVFGDDRGHRAMAFAGGVPSMSVPMTARAPSSSSSSPAVTINSSTNVTANGNNAHEVAEVVARQQRAQHAKAMRDAHAAIKQGGP